MRHHCHCNPTKIYKVGGICPSCRGRTHDVAERHGDNAAKVTLSKADGGIDRDLLSEPKTGRESPAGTESRLAALTTATARELANELATQAHARDPSRPFAWHLGMIFETRPELYESENRVSDLASKRRYAATPSDVGLD
jgi:hypothetical protein